MLELIDCTKKYGEKTALDHLSVRFETGVYGLLGANGAGKSTMLNLITDNIPRTEGQILYNGTEIRKLGRAYFKKIGYTPQLQGMYDDFTARDFLHYIGSSSVKYGLKKNFIFFAFSAQTPPIRNLCVSFATLILLLPPHNV